MSRPNGPSHGHPFLSSSARIAKSGVVKIAYIGRSPRLRCTGLATLAKRSKTRIVASAIKLKPSFVIDFSSTGPRPPLGRRTRWPRMPQAAAVLVVQSPTGGTAARKSGIPEARRVAELRRVKTIRRLSRLSGRKRCRNSPSVLGSIMTKRARPFAVTVSSIVPSSSYPPKHSQSSGSRCQRLVGALHNALHTSVRCGKVPRQQAVDNQGHNRGSPSNRGVREAYRLHRL